MKNILHTVIFALFVFITNLSQAQSYSLENVGRFGIRNSGPIVDKNVIKGYYLFYASEKIDKKNSAFEIVVLDDNLKEIVAEKIIEPKSTFLLEASYNGDVVLFKFYESKEHEIHYRTLNNSGKLSDKQTRAANSVEVGMYNNTVAKDIANVNVNPFGKYMFIDLYGTNEGKGYSYAVQAIDNNGNSKWTFEPDHEKGVDAATFLTANEKNVVLLGSYAKNAMSRDVIFKIVVLSAEGSLVYETPLQNDENNMVAHNAYFEEATGNLVVIGEYYDIDDKSQKAESKGIFAKVLDKNGDNVSESFISWDKDILKKVAQDDKKEIKNYSMYFHNIIKAADGKILAVSEQYRKQVSAGGVALKLAASAMGGSTNSSSLEIKIGKMVIIELNSDYTLSDVKIIDKKSNIIVLSQDYGLVNQHVLAKMLKADGSFDYSYTQNNSDNSIITVGYIDKEKVEGKGKLKAVFNAVNYLSTDGTYSNDKVVLETDASYLNVMPARPGYVLIAEHFRKRKTLSYRLEPLNL